jgi:hypothetical protein
MWQRILVGWQSNATKNPAAEASGDRYREQCEKVKHSQLRGTPAVYPRQIPFLESR